MNMIPLLVGVVVVLSVVSLLFFLRGGKRYSWLEYWMKCRDAGFSSADMQTISKAARLAGVQDTTNVFWSPRDLDKTLAILIGEHKTLSTREGAAFIEKVYELRKRLEFEQPRYKAGIRGSRQLAQGQRVRLLVQGVGVFGSTILDNNSQYLVVTYPSGTRLPPGFVWKGKKLSVYFWRRDDAGYVFDSYILDDLRMRNVPVLHLGHSESLLRTQKRRSVRSKAKLSGYLYILKRIEGAFEKTERDLGLRCVIQDLSEDGFSVLIGGKAKVGMAVKVQFYLGERQIVMSGKVKTADVDSDSNRSVLHVEAIQPSPRTRNAIRSFVYNIQPSAASGGLPEAPD